MNISFYVFPYIPLERVVIVLLEKKNLHPNFQQPLEGFFFSSIALYLALTFFPSSVTNLFILVKKKASPKHYAATTMRYGVQFKVAFKSI